MTLLFHFCRTCYFSIIITTINGYVLFAANLEDFRNMAKKFVPDKLADQLADMASASSIKYRQEEDSRNKEYESQEDTADNKRMGTMTQEKHAGENTFNIPKIDLLALLNTVKEKLGEVYKSNKSLLSKKDKVTHIGTNIKKDVNKVQTRNSQSSTSKVQQHKINKNWYEQEPQFGEKFMKNTTNEEPIEDTHDDGLIFKEIHMTGKEAKDSYEDYVTPKKDNVFDSDETTTYKSKQKARQYMKKKTVNDEWLPMVETDKEDKESDYDEVSKPDEPKAKTEDLLYDYKASVDKEVTLNKANIKKIGTMIPTKKYYRMSSPNYYAKLPLIAEKYDFNEPIPEKDREPEVLKPIGNPPASINGRIQLTL